MLSFKVKVTYIGNEPNTTCQTEYVALSYDSKTALLDVITEFKDEKLLKVSVKCLGEK